MAQATQNRNGSQSQAAQAIAIAPGTSFPDAMAAYTRHNGNVFVVDADGKQVVGLDALNWIHANDVKAARGGVLSLAEFLSLEGFTSEESKDEKGNTKLYEKGPKAGKPIVRNTSPARVFTIEAKPMEFSTGSFGWNGGGAINVELSDGRKVKATVSCNIIVKGSDEAPRK